MAALLGETRIDSQRRIQRFLDRPSVENWESIYALRIAFSTTVWQAVMEVDPSFQTERLTRTWNSIPLPSTVMKAIGTVVSREGNQ